MITPRLIARMLGLALLSLAAGFQPALAQTAIDEPGIYHHRFADAYFPVQIGEFRRADLHRYDDEARDVSGNYNLITPAGRLLITVYIYPSPPVGDASENRAARQKQLCDREVDSFTSYLSEQHGGARPREDGEAMKVPDVDPKLSRRTVFLFDSFFGDRVQPVRAEAHYYCYVAGAWQVKYRITTPVAVDGREAVERFIRTGPWPGRAMSETIARSDDSPRLPRP
jgi:hypothetical protein